MKITICGSMTNSKKMVEIKNQLEQFGHEITLPEFTYEFAKMEMMDKIKSESAHNKIEHDLIKGYFDKIRESDAVLIVNIDKDGIANYIGGNSFLELGFGHVLEKKTFLLNPIPDVSYIDEIKAMRPIIIDGDLEKIK